MSLRLDDCTFFGPALPEPFVKFQLEGILQKKGLLPPDKGAAGKALQERWEVYRRRLRELGQWGLSIKVANHVLLPLAPILGYNNCDKQDPVETREGVEDGGWLMQAGADGSCLRAWSVEAGDDLDAPNRRGRAYRFSPSRVAQRVLLAEGERVGLLTDGTELRVLICDPARPDSHISFGLDRGDGWRAARTVPDSFRLLVALTSPAGVKAVPELTEDARLAQSGVTKKLRLQAREAIEQFLQCVLDHPANRERLAAIENRQELAGKLWREGLTLVYRLLFTLKLESSPDPARAFSFSSTSLWRRTYSPNSALVRLVKPALDGLDTGGLLEGGLRSLFRLFREGLASSEMKVNPLGGMLFGRGTTPLLDELRWGEKAVATLLRNLLWTKEGNKEELRRVYYGSLDVEDMGRVYEALLELEPGITSEPMCRLRRAKLEVVLPVAQGERYREDAVPGGIGGTAEEADPTSLSELRRASGDADDEEEAEADEEAEVPAKKGKTKVEWIEDIQAGRFYLRVGLGRKSSGSYYTPHPFVRFLVQETLEPQIKERSPTDNPHPGEILKLKVLDPAMGSGHFLVEACRYLGDHLYEACRQCDELAVLKEEEAKRTFEQAESLQAQARELLQRVVDLPDPDDALVAYLPSRVAEGHESGLSLNKAKALCRRLVAVHCLYGVDKNPLAVELAKLAIWLESYAEGLPLTFMDHRLICGDSLTGPFFEHLLTFPGSGDAVADLFTRGLSARLSASLDDALRHIRNLEATVGTDVHDLALKRDAKERLDNALAPFKLLAMAWSGGVMLGKKECDDTAYALLMKAIADGEDWESLVLGRPVLGKMVLVGKDGIPYDLVFPEVFCPAGNTDVRRGFDAVVGNPPWDRMLPADREFFAAFDLRVLDAPTKRERDTTERALRENVWVLERHAAYIAQFRRAEGSIGRLYSHQVVEVDGARTIGKQDLYRLFMERGTQVLRHGGLTGVVVPSAFHANEGATGIRRLYLEEMALKYCFSFENRKKLFDIHASFKFAAVVAANTGQPTDHFHCAFYLHDLDWLFEDRGALVFSLPFLRQMAGEYLTMLELRSPLDSNVAKVCYGTGRRLQERLADEGIRIGRELNMTDDAWRFAPVVERMGTSCGDPRHPDCSATLRNGGLLLLHEGKTFWQYDDLWGEGPRFVVPVQSLADKPEFVRAAMHFRLAYREIAASTNERTLVFACLPPGCVAGHKGPNERRPWSRPSSAALELLAQANSFATDFLVRLQAGSGVSKFVLMGIPFPVRPGHATFYSHSALRLTCNHAGYAPLWLEQVGDAWLEAKPKHSWPVLEGDDERWKVRAAIDAVVADAYGLNREQYRHVLSTFSHKSYPKAPELCLAMFDELKGTGLEAFTKKHDPYWDIPLNENLPKPVIDIPGLEELKEETPPTKKTGGRKGGMLFPVGDGPLFRKRG
jgi:hypothetical protein